MGGMAPGGSGIRAPWASGRSPRYTYVPQRMAYVAENSAIHFTVSRMHGMLGDKNGRQSRSATFHAVTILQKILRMFLLFLEHPRKPTPRAFPKTGATHKGGEASTAHATELENND